MSRFRLLLAFVASVTLSLVVPPLRAAEPHLEFLNGLRELGYGEMAIFYLEQLKARPQLPEELAEIYEMELGLCKRVWADEAPTPELAVERMAQAQKHLEGFLTSHPQHEARGDALDTLGDLLSHRAQSAVKLARAAKDPMKQAAYYAEARKTFTAARTWLTQAVAWHQQQLQALQPQPKQPAPEDSGKTKTSRKTSVRRTPRPMNDEQSSERQEAEFTWLETRMRLAMVDYFEAQTYADPNDKARKDVLKKAAGGFDAIYQGYRGNIVGVYAHMWHGRCSDEMGDVQNALDVYDEVLVYAEPGEDRSGLEDLLAQVEFFRLQILRKKGEHAAFAQEATEWLKFNAAARTTPGFQGISLELCKYQIEQGAAATGDARRRLFGTVLKQLADMTKVRSEYQQEAFLLRRQYQAEYRGEAMEIGTFDEGIAVANEALAGGRWEEALAAYTKALELGDKSKDPERAINARFRMAYAQLLLGKVDEALKAAEAVARENPGSPSAPQAASLAVSAALQLYATAQDKPVAQKRFSELAEFTIKNWPKRPEADEARIALGQSANVAGDMKTALATFESVSPQSERYPQALYYAGQTYWRAYVIEKQKPATERDAQLMADVRTKAHQRLTDSVAGQEKLLKPGDPPTRQLGEARLLLGEIALEGGNPHEAIAHLGPLADAIAVGKPQQLDSSSLRTLTAALRAQSGLLDAADHTKAAVIAGVLAQAAGTDTPLVNSVLIEYAKLCDYAYKQAQAGVIESEKSTDQAEKDAAAANLKEAQARLVQALDQTAPRQQLSLASMVYIAETLGKAQETAKARETFDRIIKRAEQDPAFVPAKSAGAITRVRAQLVGLLRNEDKFAEAMKQAEALIKTTQGKVLEPLMEKGRILQAWAEKEPKRYDEAVTHWTNLRTTLSRMQKKPPEYYEVIFNTATCLMAQYAQTKDKSKALQAEQVLKATLVLSPSLSGPDMVARYNRLLESATQVRGSAAPAKTAPAAQTKAAPAAQAKAGTK